MALALRRARTPIARPRSQVLYCRPPGTFTAHDALVAQLCEENDGTLDVVTLKPREAAHRLRTWVSATQPTLVVIRNGDVIAIAVGALPRVELARLIHRALS